MDLDPAKIRLIVAVGIALAVAISLFSWLFLFRRGKVKDLKPVVAKDWDPNDILGSLRGVAENMEEAAATAADWYWREKAPQARASRLIQASTVFLTAAAGLVPVTVELAARYLATTVAPWWTTGLWASVFVGTAAGLLGLDRAFGFSSGWTRNVLAATEITRRLTEFKMTWLSLTAAIPKDATPTPEQVARFIQAATDFRVGVAGVVVQETKEWATEFQNNIAQLEKDVKAQLEALKVQVQQQRKDRESASQTGSIEATVPNADKAKDFTFFVSLEGADGPILKDEKVVNSRTWSKLALKADQYKLTVAADTTATPSTRKSKTTVVVVKPGEIAKPSLDLTLD